MLFLTLEQILMMHALVLLHDGGADGVRDIGRLEAAVATQHQEVFGEELYVGVYAKSAALIRGIINDHAFSDGNKRTAMLTGMTLLEINGLKLNINTQEIEDFAVQVAVEHLNVDQIADWLKAHSNN